jgi:hypothetical protein
VTTVVVVVDLLWKGSASTTLTRLSVDDAGVSFTFFVGLAGLEGFGYALFVVTVAEVLVVVVVVVVVDNDDDVDADVD